MMTAAKRYWLAAAGMAAALAAALAVAASILASRLEPYARQAAIGYLSQRFACDVQLGALRVEFPKTSWLRLVWTRGKGVSAHIVGEDLVMRLNGRRDSVRLFSIRRFDGDISLDSLLHPPVAVSRIAVEGMQIQIPPRRDHDPASPPIPEHDGRPSPANPGVTIGSVGIHNAVLILESRDPQRFPLEFDIERLELQAQGPGAAMKFEASLTNAKPPGQIHTAGTFGPWQAEEPGDTPLSGEYSFENADLGVFAGIAGTLHSSGQFAGKLSAISAHGDASVPDFRLRVAGNPVPLRARFAVLVDATNGNTILQPVAATLGSTPFTTTGGIIRHQEGQPRAISLNVAMPNGNLADVLRVAMKGPPFMEGRLVLNTKIDIPPLAGKVREKLELEGSFEVLDGKFLHSTIQNQIDSLSRRAQGQPQNGESDSVVSGMKGAFHMENAAIHFGKLTFGVPGADLDLSGDYDLDADALDFDGTLKLQATVSQMITGSQDVTGWKGTALKTIDRFFEKDGAGTSLHIRVGGTSHAPKFAVVLAGKQVGVPLPKR